MPVGSPDGNWRRCGFPASGSSSSRPSASSLGTLVAAIALAIDVKDRTDSGIWVGAVLIVEFLPTIVVGLSLGPLLDRLERRSLMIGADLTRVAVFCVLPFATSPAAIVALATVAGLANGFFRPAVFASVPNLVPEEQLSEANALLVDDRERELGDRSDSRRCADGGVRPECRVLDQRRVVPRLRRCSSRASRSGSSSPQTALSRGHWADLADGFRTVAHSRALLAVLVGWGIASLGIGGANVAEIFLAKDVFNSGDVGYGFLYAAIGTGLVIGSFWSSRLIDRIGIARAYGLALGLMAVGFTGAAAEPDRLGRGCLLRRRRARRRRGDRLQRAARAARGAGRDARAVR